MKYLLQHSPPHPGEVLSELYLAPQKFLVKGVAAKLRISRAGLSAIINGKAPVTAMTALKLARAFKTTPLYWLTLQMNYDLWIATETGRSEINKVPVLFLVLSLD